MREIKFRAWDNAEKKMLDTVESWNQIWKGDDTDPDNDYDYHFKCLYINREGHILEHTDEHGICDMDFYFQGKPKYELMQYTGLKDKNGKEIYEGDITRDGIGNIDAIVSHSAGYFAVKRGSDHTFIEGDRLEVIGNIYENPELPKGQQK